MTTMCEGCHAGCCRSFAVPISGADVLRIERERGLTFAQFACRWADEDGQIARNYAPHFHFEDDLTTPFVICLQHESSRYFPGTTMCRFLEESAPTEEHPIGTARCGIHSSRPSACRAFPTKLNETAELVVIHDVPPRGRTGEPVYSLCPKPWPKDEIDPLTGMQDLVVAKYEMRYFHTIAQVWNRTPRPWSVFPDFLHFVYSSRVTTEAELAGEVPPTIPMEPFRDDNVGGLRRVA